MTNHSSCQKRLRRVFSCHWEGILFSMAKVHIYFHKKKRNREKINRYFKFWR